VGLKLFEEQRDWHNRILLAGVFLTPGDEKND
jgi:hypothetical protein